jgi:hypothetical protein
VFGAGTTGRAETVLVINGLYYKDVFGARVLTGMIGVSSGMLNDPFLSCREEFISKGDGG